MQKSKTTNDNDDDGRRRPNSHKSKSHITGVRLSNRPHNNIIHSIQFNDTWLLFPLTMYTRLPGVPTAMYPQTIYLLTKRDENQMNVWRMVALEVTVWLELVHSLAVVSIWLVFFFSLHRIFVRRTVVHQRHVIQYRFVPEKKKMEWKKLYNFYGSTAAAAVHESQRHLETKCSQCATQSTNMC